MRIVVVLMDCDGLRTRSNGRGVHRQGASAFITWTDRVAASHTDLATELLLKNLLLQEGQPAVAVALTAAEVGPAP